MTYPTYRPNDRGPGERWSFNLPLAIGVVFVFLVGVVAWVIVSSGDDDGDTLAESTATTSSVAIDTTTTSLAPPLTASPIPIPSITIITVPSTTALVPIATVPAAPITVPVTVPVTQPAPPSTGTPDTTTTTAPVPPTLAPVTPTTAPGASDNAVPGDLAVPGHPMSKPACDDKAITIIASAIGDQATGASIGAVLEDYDGAEYLRTDQTCPSLTQSSNGQPIYVVYLGPFGSDTGACQARSRGPQGSYVRRLSSTLGPDHFVACP
jgi:hypothetical protein